MEARHLNGFRLEQALTMNEDDLEAANSLEAPDRVAPTVLAGVRVEGSTMTATVRPASCNVVRLAETA